MLPYGNILTFRRVRVPGYPLPLSTGSRLPQRGGVDMRFRLLAGGGVARAHVGPGQTLTVPVAGQAGVPASGAGAVALAVMVALS